VPQDDMSWAVLGRCQSSEEGVVQREPGGGDAEAMVVVLIVCCVRKMEKVGRDGRYL
jgi:hypothetical protein